MLTIQRASAGSGKTFTLAKTFIRQLLFYKTDGGKMRIRNQRQMADALPRILAITFTNKATNEMKERIVEKLAALSTAENISIPDRKVIDKIDYLEEFHNETGFSYQDIGSAAKSALSILLNKYSDFKVSTIDAFFQEILRTFTYEAGINDNYEVEIDSEFIGGAAIDSTLIGLKESSPIHDDSVVKKWIDIIMSDKSTSSTGWNLFAKSESNSSLYKGVKNSLRKLESEQFKAIKPFLERYLKKDGGSGLYNFYEEFKEKAIKERKTILEEIKKLVKEIFMLFEKYPGSEEDCHKNALNQFSKIIDLKYDDSKFDPKIDNYKESILKKSAKSGAKDLIEKKGREIYQNLEPWLNLGSTPLWEAWKVFGPLIPSFGLLMEIKDNLNEFLDTNNLIQISETSYLLKSIIGDDDTPFIFERMGTYLENYLIDEFQDTSKMQWSVMYPLLNESIASDKDSLIIGDAKQSIYRFRNADPSLITSEVPKQFPDYKGAGSSIKDNTNWRSDQNIVEFNNFFFNALALKLASLSEENGNSYDFIDLYSNVVQYPHKQNKRGYVEINFIPKGKQDSEEDDEKGDFNTEVLSKIGPLISGLIKRGYNQKDIVILVNTNQQGKDIIEALIDYNSNVENNDTKIEFISAESLLVSSSRAVRIIMEVIEKMAIGFIDRNAIKENSHEKVLNKNLSWNKIKTNFAFYSLRHPELSPEERLSNFLEEESADDTISYLLSRMQTVALPALVEEITDCFIAGNSLAEAGINISESEVSSLVKTDAIFISAFQDIVLDYCEHHSPDPASFLDWWKLRGANLSISSPEGTDAVEIMTIHKSKGLEFDCVIIPFAKSSLTPSDLQAEWRWADTSSLKDSLECDCPPYLPLETKRGLTKTSFAPIYKQYFDEVVMDKLNTYYVAFTRAKSELYIFSEKPTPKSGNTISKFLWQICNEPDEYPCRENEKQFCADISLFSIKPGETEDEYAESDNKPQSNNSADEEIDLADPNIPAIVSYGKLPVFTKQNENKVDENKNIEDNPDSEHLIDIYYVNANRPLLHFKETNDDSADSFLPDDDDEDDGDDPRSEGNILHELMSMIEVKADLPRALTKMRMKGYITAETAQEWGKSLSNAMGCNECKAWFDGSMKAYNERGIINGWDKIKRPDRIMVTPDRTKAVIVDYKFGQKEDPKYKKQVNEYINLFKKASGISDVKGYLWYVNLNKVVPII